MLAANRPPAVDPLVALADRCVQCGLCLPVCPTYARDRLEAESPRGRIALVRAWALETIEPGATGDDHLDHCLACRACEAVCPAGVEYGALLVTARGRQRQRRGANLLQRLLEALTARPRLLTGLLGMYRRIHRLLPTGLRVLPRPPRPDPSTTNPPTAASVASSIDDPAGTQSVRPVPDRHAAAGWLEPGSDRGDRQHPGAHAPVAVFVGCVANAYEADVRAALGRLCAALSIDLVTPAGQTCCGAIHAHAGNLAQASRLSAINHTAFAGYPRVLTLASGCHESVAGALDGTAVDALAFLDEHRERLTFAERRERIGLHLPCTQRNVVGTVPALRRLLARVPGLVVVELDAGYGCCGAAGSQMLTDPDRAASYRQPLLAQLAASGATRLLSANIGCRLHLAGGTALEVQHPLAFLADALVVPGDVTTSNISVISRNKRSSVIPAQGESIALTTSPWK
ncbi:(Fe-S)-binding protein [Lysobacter sp. A378]